MTEHAEAGVQAAQAAATPPERSEAAVPVLRILAGRPTPAEIAALVAVLTRLDEDGEPEPAAAVRAGGWADPARRFGRPLRPGPGAWRSSSWG